MNSIKNILESITVIGLCLCVGIQSFEAAKVMNKQPNDVRQRVLKQFKP